MKAINRLNKGRRLLNTIEKGKVAKVKYNVEVFENN